MQHIRPALVSRQIFLFRTSSNIQLELRIDSKHENIVFLCGNVSHPFDVSDELELLWADTILLLTNAGRVWVVPLHKQDEPTCFAFSVPFSTGSIQHEDQMLYMPLHLHILHQSAEVKLNVLVADIQVNHCNRRLEQVFGIFNHGIQSQVPA